MSSFLLQIAYIIAPHHKHALYTGYSPNFGIHFHGLHNHSTGIPFCFGNLRIFFFALLSVICAVLVCLVAFFAFEIFYSFLFLNNIIPITNFQISGFLIFHLQKVTRTSDVMAAKSLVVVAVNNTRPKNYRTIRVLGTRLTWASFLSLGGGRIPLTMFLTMSPVPHKYSKNLCCHSSTPPPSCRSFSCETTILRHSFHHTFYAPTSHMLPLSSSFPIRHSMM